MKKTDVVIIGGGPVGLALANALLVSDIEFLVIEAKLPENFSKESQAIRVSAINTAAKNFLQQLGVWEAMQSVGVSPFESMHVWDALSTGSITLQAADVAASELGFIVENRLLQSALWQKLSKERPESLIVADDCQQLTKENETWQLRLRSGKEINANLIIGADGADSWLRDQLAIESQVIWYNQRAIIANVKVDASHERTAYQRFLATGPLAFLPLMNKHHCSIVWTLPDAKALELCALSEDEFNQELSEAFAKHLGRVNLMSARMVFPLRHQHAQSYVLAGAALIGDAAHSIHPLAGQGVNLGFADAVSLAKVLMNARKLKRPIASLSNLQRYERERRHENAVMLKAMTGFNALFSTDNVCLVRMREFGLNGVNKSSVLKKFFIKKAMG